MVESIIQATFYTVFVFNYNETKKQKAEKSSDLSVLKTKKIVRMNAQQRSLEDKWGVYLKIVSYKKI